MKKLLWVLVLFGLIAGRSWGQELSENQRWIEQVDAGLVIPGSSNASNNYAVGAGGDVLMGYRFDRDFSLSADIGYFDSDQKTLGGANGEWDYTPLMAVARVNIGRGWIRPYFILGAGVAFNNFSLTVGQGKATRTETDFLAAPGFGFLVVVASDMAVYVQGRVDVDFAQNSVGIPSADNPTVFIPVKAGVAFFAL